MSIVIQSISYRSNLYSLFTSTHFLPKIHLKIAHKILSSGELNPNLMHSINWLWARLLSHLHTDMQCWRASKLRLGSSLTPSGEVGFTLASCKHFANLLGNFWNLALYGVELAVGCIAEVNWHVSANFYMKDLISLLNINIWHDFI